jgi:predicted metal-dependent enzyme (double-stranded beta helix superfamily)
MKKLILPASLASLIESIGDKSDFKQTEIVQLINNCGIKKEDLKDFEDFDHAKEDGYGRKLVFKSTHFEILVMSWAPRDFTAIHNHGYTSWGAVQTFGRLEHATFQLEGETLSSLFKEKLTADEIISVDQNLIHQMGNPYNENTLSLHVYGCPHEVNSITESSQLFEVGKGEIQLVDAGVFYDLPASKVAVSDTELISDRLTMIGHYIQLLNYYYKTGTRGPQYKKAINYFLDRSFESRLITELEMDSNCVLYMIELNKARELLILLSESTKIIDSILSDIKEPEN